MLPAQFMIIRLLQGLAGRGKGTLRDVTRLRRQDYNRDSLLYCHIDLLRSRAHIDPLLL